MPFSPFSQHATAPAVGDAAPDFVIPESTESGRLLSDLRGSSIVVAFHPPTWDPARAEEIGALRRAVATGSASTVRSVLIRNDHAAAIAYGVAGGSAVFVIDPAGRVAWRYVSGTDSLDGATHGANDESAVRCGVADLRGVTGRDAHRSGAPVAI